jgi:SAM-dependent methyltransferase
LILGEAYYEPGNRQEMLRPEQKSIGTISEFLQRYSYVGSSVVDMFCGTGSTAVACALLRRNFLGCDVSEACVLAGKRRVVELFEGGWKIYERLFVRSVSSKKDWRSADLFKGAKNPESDDTTPESKSGKSAFDVAQVFL